MLESIDFIGTLECYHVLLSTAFQLECLATIEFSMYFTLICQCLWAFAMYHAVVLQVVRIDFISVYNGLRVFLVCEYVCVNVCSSIDFIGSVACFEQ